MDYCPKCNRQLKNINAWHYCGENSIDNLFEGKKQALLYVFDAVLADVIDWEDVAVSATKNCIVFVRNKTFLVIKPMSTALNIKFYLPERREEYPIFKSEAWNSKFETNIRLHTLEDVTPTVINFIRKSYEMS
jgi:hypothetical protein